MNRVRNLYAKRSADVRFLIPVLNGLTRQEIYAALPKLIKLNPGVVKEVFNRLLGTGNASITGAMSPADLMIALHNIDSAKCDMKTVIKATGICFQDKNVFSMEVLTIVLQQLMEQKDIPLLLMRTVIQSVALYPNLIGFTMNILQRLIVKQVWKQKMLWEGFIKCCERTKPQSFRVLLQLPPAQLRMLLDSAPDMREPLLEQVQGFTESQRQHVPASIMAVLRMSPDSDQAILNYIAQLRAAARQCDFKLKCPCGKDNDFTESIILYKLVAGVSDMELQEELLKKADLTLAVAEKLAVAKESAKFSQAAMPGEGVSGLKSSYQRSKSDSKDKRM